MNNSTLCKSNFYKVEDLKFDILKLRKALRQVLSRKKYDDAVGTKYIAGISLNQIPGDPDSIKGENVKGIYWTKPDSSGIEAMRAKRIDEAKYTEFVKDLEDTYFKEVYDILSKKFKLGRVRILLKEPRSTLSWHRDPEPSFIFPLLLIQAVLWSSRKLQNTFRLTVLFGLLTI